MVIGYPRGETVVKKKRSPEEEVEVGNKNLFISVKVTSVCGQRGEREKS